MIRYCGIFVMALSIVVIAVGTCVLTAPGDLVVSIILRCFGLLLLLAGGMTFLKRKLGIVLICALSAPVAYLFIGDGIYFFSPELSAESLLVIGTMVSMTVLWLLPIAVAVVGWKEFDSWV